MAELQGPILFPKIGLLKRAIYTQELLVGWDVFSSAPWSEAPLVIPASFACGLSQVLAAQKAHNFLIPSHYMLPRGHTTHPLRSQYFSTVMRHVNTIIVRSVYVCLLWPSVSPIIPQCSWEQRASFIDFCIHRALHSDMEYCTCLAVAWVTKLLISQPLTSHFLLYAFISYYHIPL